MEDEDKEPTLAWPAPEIQPSGKTRPNEVWAKVQTTWAERRRVQQNAKRAARDLKQAEELSASEQFGNLVLQETCAGKTVRIYDKGFVRVSMFPTNSTPYERLLGISGSADVAKKTALGRSIAAGATLGANLLFTPNKRGDLYLVITTDRETHSLHMSPPTERDLKAMHKLRNAGQAVLNGLASAPERSEHSTEDGSFVVPRSVTSELQKLAEMFRAGLLTEEEFKSAKSRLLSE